MSRQVARVCLLRPLEIRGCKMNDFEKEQEIIDEDIEVENVDTTPEKEGEYEDSETIMMICRCLKKKNKNLFKTILI